MHIIGYYIHIHSLFLCNMYKLNSFGIGFLFGLVSLRSTTQNDSCVPLRSTSRITLAPLVYHLKSLFLTGNLIVVFNCYLRSLGRYFSLHFLNKTTTLNFHILCHFKFHITTSIFILAIFLKVTFSHKIVTFCTLL